MSTASRPALLSVASRRSPLRISTSDVSWMSAAVTSAGPRTSSRRVTGSSLCDTSTMSFRLRMTSVTSSTTPGMVSNSCRASSKRTCVMAAPGIDDSSVRRSELPRVWPKPGSRGPMANRCRLPSSSVTGSTVGRCMTSMTRGSFVRLRGVRATGDDVGAAGGSLAVELDDQLLAHGGVDVLTQRVLADLDRQALVLGVEPRRWRAGQHVTVPLDDDHLPGLAPQRDDVALADPVAGDVDAPAVDVDVAVPDELPGLRAGRRPAGAVDDVVETPLEELQHDLAGHALAARRLLVEVAELPLVEAVGEAGLLLLLQLEQVLGGVAAAAAAVLARRVGPTLERTVLAGGTPDVGAEAAGDSGFGTGVTGHLFVPA